MESVASPNTAGLAGIFEVLAHPCRRYVLYHMRTNSGVVTTDTLSAMLVDELDRPDVTTGEATHEQIGIALHHSHLPKLADAGFITIAQDRGSIELIGMNGLGQFIDDAARIDGYAPPTVAD